jgi:hypothetical protein
VGFHPIGHRQRLLQNARMILLTFLGIAILIITVANFLAM